MALTGEATESGAGSYLSNVTPTVLYTSAQAVGKVVRIDKLLLKNVSGSAVLACKLFKVASGGAISGNDWLIWQGDLDANGQEDVREVCGLYLDSGDSLRGLAGTASAVRFDLSVMKES